MEHLISIQSALELPAPLFIDLRSPAEFVEAHIPEALNIPLLDNEERAIIGTIYKEISPEKATEEGLSIVAPRLPELYAKLKELSQNNDIILYCWRGGMRSKALCQILSVMGIKHYRLEGGYKAFRHFVLEYFSQPFLQEIIVLDGLTGVGKTDMLEFLIRDNYPAVDLEGLACNKGSVFGHIGYSQAPTQKQFEGLLFSILYKVKHNPRIIVECESSRIGRISLPTSFFTAMENGRRILVYDSLENRVKRLVKTYTLKYTRDNDIELSKALDHLRKRLGHIKVNYLLELLDKQEYNSIVKVLLEDYYDPLYRYPDEPSLNYELNLNAQDMAGSIDKLKSLLNLPG